MNFEDEEYVRLYCKDTVTVRKIGWEGRLVLWEIMRKVDLAGVLDLQAEDDEVEAVSSLIGVPEEIVRVGLARLASRGVTAHHGPNLVVTKFVEAQNAKRSDRLRAQEYRERKKLEAAIASGESSQTPDESDAPSRGVTQHHDSSLPALPRPAPPPPALPREERAREPVSETKLSTPKPLSSSKRQELSLLQAAPEDVAVLEAWRDRFKKDGVFFTADRAVAIAERRAEDMTHQDALDALEGAAADEWFMGQGAKLELVFGKRARFEAFRDAGRAIREGTAPPRRPKGAPAPRQPDSGTYSPLSKVERA